jgi:hypothetical protein
LIVLCHVYMCPCKFLMDTILAAYAWRFKMGLPGAYAERA